MTAAIVGHRAAGYHVDMEQIAREMATDPKDDLKFRLRRLTYSDMMEVCQGILEAADRKPMFSKEDLAEVLDRWAGRPPPRQHACRAPLAAEFVGAFMDCALPSGGDVSS